MPTVTLPIPINGYSDSLNHQHGAEGFSTSMMNVIPIDNWEHRRRVGTRQGFAALADLGESDDYNVQDLLAYEVYRDTNMLNEVLIVSGSSGPLAATATVTFTGNNLADRTITITDTAGTTVVYTAKASTTVADNEFKRDGTVTEIADALELCIENSAGHNGTISASNVLGVLTLTQVSEGTGGNNTITFTLDAATVSGFVSGDDNSGVFYVDSSGDTNDVLYSVDAATATVTFTGAPTVDQTIIITDTAGTSKTYTMKSAENLASNDFAISYSTATVTITAFAELNGDGEAGSDNVNLVATDDTNYNFYCGDHSSVAGTWSSATSNDATATSLMNVINTSSGPAGTRFTATVLANVVTITQATAGADGNTAITLTDSGTAGMSKTDFTTETDDDVSSVAASLAACINDASGHGATITAVATDKVVALTQDVLGTETSTGNTDITSTLDNATATNFSGAAYAAGTGRIQKYDGVRAVQFGDTAYLVTGRHYYKIVLSATTPVIEEWTNLNGSGGMPTDDVGNKCSLISLFGGRLVMSGLSSSRNNWFMSKIGDAEDWTPTALSSSDAQAGDSSTNFGKLGEPITAIFPFGEAGLMMAGRNTLTFLTADPVVSGAQFVRMSNGVGVMGPDAWCQGPEKTCYIASGDGVYLIQPNDFNIQRGQSITTARLDGFFSGINPSEVSLHLAYDPPRSTILMFVNREGDPDNVIHYQHHIPTQSWWTFKVSDPRMDVIRATCLYTPISGERVGLWVGCKSGRILTQPNSGVLSYDGGSHTSPLRASSDNSPDDAKVAFTSRLAWSPINSGLTNERLLMTEIDVLLDTHTVTSTVGITPVGPTLTLYGAETAQTLSGVSGDILVTETQLTIDGGEGAFVADDPSTSFDCGNADTKAYAIITVADGDAVDHGIAELQYITLTSTANVTKTYVVTDGNASGVATGVVLAEGSDYGSDTIPAGHALIGGIAVQINTTGSVSNAYTFLVQLKAAINHANGHNAGGSSVFTFIDPTAGAAADGAQSLTIIQAVVGRGGNTPITETIASSVTIPSVFVGGQTTAVGTEYTPAIEATISLHDSSISNLNNETIILNDLASGTSAVTLTFDSSLGVDASTATSIGCSDVGGNLFGIMKGIKKSIDLNYQAGLLNIRTEEPTLYAADEARMVLRMSDAWNGLDLLSGLTLTGTAIDSDDIQDETFALQAGTNWKQFITGGRAADTTGTYTLNDSAASESLRKWSRLSSYTVRRGGNTAVSEPAQFDGRWGVFGTDDTTVPFYLATEETATLSLSTITSTELLPAGFTASTVIIDPQQDSSTKRELATFALNKGRNNRFRIRKRESDFQIQISASGTTWVLEDIAANIEQGGPYRSVVTA